MILSDDGINWVWFYNTDDMTCWREHKVNLITVPDKSISFWTDKECHTYDGEIFKFKAKDFKLISD